MPKVRVVPCIDVKGGPRRPQPRGGEAAQTRKEAAL